MLRKHNKPLQRQLQEAVRIKNKPKDENLNSKSEYHGQRIKRITVDGSDDHDCKVCGAIFQSKSDFYDHFQKFHKRFICEKCNYKSFGKSGLSEHTRIVHTDQQ